MRALLIDDERLARVELRRLLRAHAEIEIAGEAHNAAEALTQIDALRPEVLFLDVQMPECDGFGLLEQLDSVPKVIFCTAFDVYALKAFEVSAVDYLVKPIAPERLAAAVAKLSSAMPPGIAGDKQIFVKDGDHCWFVTLRDVVLLESEGNYTRLYFGGDRPLILRSLNYLEERLDSAMFFRASRKHIINLKFVEALTPEVHGGFEVRLKGGHAVDMSRRQAVRFKEAMSL